ncbi:hypothetical protein GGI43DRAFT_94196 [Trichoderma evansii]
MPISSAYRPGEGISKELQALRSSEDASYAKPCIVKTIPSSQIISDGNTTAPAKPAQGPTLLWLGITDSDSACSYNLGTSNLDVQTVIELFQ